MKTTEQEQSMTLPECIINLGPIWEREFEQRNERSPTRAERLKFVEMLKQQKQPNQMVVRLMKEFFLRTKNDGRREV